MEDGSIFDYPTIRIIHHGELNMILVLIHKVVYNYGMMKIIFWMIHNVIMIEDFYAIHVNGHN